MSMLQCQFHVAYMSDDKWKTQDPILPLGCLAVNTDTGETKLGDGVRRYSRTRTINTHELPLPQNHYHPLAIHGFIRNGRKQEIDINQGTLKLEVSDFLETHKEDRYLGFNQIRLIPDPVDGMSLTFKKGWTKTHVRKDPIVFTVPPMDGTYWLALTLVDVGDGAELLSAGYSVVAPLPRPGMRIAWPGDTYTNEGIRDSHDNLVARIYVGRVTLRDGTASAISFPHGVPS